MDIIIIILGIVIIITGFIGCFIPVLPGPFIAWTSLPILYLTSEDIRDPQMIIILTLLMIGVTLLDYMLPIWGTKYTGGTRAGKIGSALGLIIGLFVGGVVGIILGPFFGAFIGELIAGADASKALKSAVGAFVGFVLGTVTKLVVVALIGLQFIYCCIW